MAKCERNGDAVLESNHVKVALVIEDAEPELRLLLREPRRTDKVVRVWTRHSLDGRSGRLDRANPDWAGGGAGVPEAAGAGAASYKVKIEGGEYV